MTNLLNTCNSYIPNHPYLPEYNLAIYVVGPGTQDDYQTDLNFLNSNFKNVMVIGDGEQGLFDENGQGILLNNLNELSSYYPWMLEQGKILVYAYMHGNVYDGNHVLVAGENDLAGYTDNLFFGQLNTYINRPMDIIFLPCHGKAALNVTNRLPDGSNILIFSEADKTTYYLNVENTIETMFTDDNLTLNKFYDNYLSNLEKFDENPIIVNVGGEIIDPLALSSNYIGSKINSVSREYVHKNLGYNICSNSVICHERLELAMDKMESAISIDDFKVTLKDKGIYLSNEIESGVNNYQFVLKDHHLRDVPYNYKDLEFCYIEILELKEKLDQLLFSMEIPLELDLSSEKLNDLDEDEEDDDDTSYFRDVSEYFAFNLLKKAGFEENDNFANPESTDYGLVLAIVKDLHLSGLSQVDDSDLI